MGEVGFGRRLPLNTSGRVFICKAFDFNLRSRLLPSGFSLTVSDMDEAVDDASTNYVLKYFVIGVQ